MINYWLAILACREKEEKAILWTLLLLRKLRALSITKTITGVEGRGSRSVGWFLL